MILSFRDDWLREFFVNDVRSKKIPSDLEDRLFRKIQMIDDATTDRDLRSPPSNHFEKLRGHLDGLHSIRVNKRWRLVFRWDSGRGEAKDLYPERDDFSSNRHPALSFCLSMIFSENRYPLFRIML